MGLGGLALAAAACLTSRVDGRADSALHSAQGRQPDIPALELSISISSQSLLYGTYGFSLALRHRLTYG